MLEEYAGTSFFERHGWIRSTFFIALVAGILIRCFCIPFTYDYDTYHWAVIIQNIDSGNGLYELFGYYYTPVWGYIMGFIDMFSNTFLSVSELGTHVSGLLTVEDLENMRHVATVTSPEFNALMKIPIILCDLFVGYILYRFVGDWTGDRRKGGLAFALWFLCPIVVYMSSVQGMFDSFSALLILLSILLVLKGHYFSGGFMLALSTLLKLFPGSVVFVFIGLVLARHRCDGLAKRNLALAVTGALLCFFIILLPNIIEGNVADSITFISDRAGGFTLNLDTIFSMGGILIALPFMIFMGHMMYRTKEDIDRKFLIYTLLVLTISMFMNIGPQYVIVLLPFLVILICSYDRSYVVCWALIGFGAFLSAFVLNNYSLLMSSSVYLGWPPYDVILSGFDWTEAYLFGTNSFRSIMNSVGYAFMGAGLILIFVFHYEDVLVRKCPKAEKYIEKIRRLSFRKEVVR